MIAKPPTCATARLRRSAVAVVAVAAGALALPASGLADGNSYTLQPSQDASFGVLKVKSYQLSVGAAAKRGSRRR